MTSFAGVIDPNRRMRMSSLRSALAWQTDAFTEIFTSSANKMYDAGYAVQEVQVYFVRCHFSAGRSQTRCSSLAYRRGGGGEMLQRQNATCIAWHLKDTKRFARKPRTNNWTRAIQCARSTFARTFSQGATKRYK